METGRVFLRRGVAPALLGAYMKQHRLVQHPGGLKVALDFGDVVAVHRADIVDAESFIQHAGSKEALEAGFASPHGIQQPVPHLGHGAHGVAYFVLQAHDAVP